MHIIKLIDDEGTYLAILSMEKIVKTSVSKMRLAYQYPGAALPAKRTTLGFTLALSLAGSAFIVK